MPQFLKEIKTRLRGRITSTCTLSQNGYGDITFHAVCTVKWGRTAWKFENIILALAKKKNVDHFRNRKKGGCADASPRFVPWAKMATVTMFSTRFVRWNGDEPRGNSKTLFWRFQKKKRWPFSKPQKGRLRGRITSTCTLSQNGYGDITFHAVCTVKWGRTAWKFENIILALAKIKNVDHFRNRKKGGCADASPRIVPWAKMATVMLLSTRFVRRSNRNSFWSSN